MRPWLLALGVAGILAVALAPHARRALAERADRAEAARQDELIRAKEAEIACLERLAASGLPKEMDVEAELARCRDLGAAH